VKAMSRAARPPRSSSKSCATLHRRERTGDSRCRTASGFVGRATDHADGRVARERPDARRFSARLGAVVRGVEARGPLRRQAPCAPAGGRFRGRVVVRLARRPPSSPAPGEAQRDYSRTLPAATAARLSSSISSTFAGVSEIESPPRRRRRSARLDHLGEFRTRDA